jgi:peptide/nickel transport system permease protein
MSAFIVRRLAAMAIVLLALTFVLFVLQKVSPFDPVRVAVGPEASQAVVAAARKRLGYDDPFIVQYLRYVGHSVTGNLGTSLRTGDPVTSDIGTFLPASIELLLAALIMATPLALLIGVASAARWRGGAFLRTGSIVFASAPSFVLSVLFVLLFYSRLHWLPAGGRTSYSINAPGGPTGLITLDGLLHARLDVVWNGIEHLILPAFALGLLPAVAVGRVLRGALLTNMRSEHVRSARARGLTETALVVRHGLRNAAGPALAIAGLMLGAMFAGLVVIETIFAWPGIGSYLAQSIPRGDFPAILGVTLLLGALYVITNTVIDVLQALADPRLRL